MAENNSTVQKIISNGCGSVLSSPGRGALADYEMLELLLFHAILRRDTKPIAKRLINHFGSYAAVLRANVKALTAVKGDGETT